MVGLNINIEKKHVFLIVAVSVFLAGIILAVALAPGETPFSGHNPDELGAPADCLIGQALVWNGTGWICSGSASSGSSCITYSNFAVKGKFLINVPDFCKFPNKCAIFGSSSETYQDVFYTQYSNGTWINNENNLPKINGDSERTDIININTKNENDWVTIYDDDSSAGETSVNRWIMESKEENLQESAIILVCPVQELPLAN
ncbi:hypothetical protein HYW76_01595 [Candidatus Pacearchaeota archaeon]|nr:hypothetical protein [Candidatus Pacearchaeota archaeon]